MSAPPIVTLTSLFPLPDIIFDQHNLKYHKINCQNPIAINQSEKTLNNRQTISLESATSSITFTTSSTLPIVSFHLSTGHFISIKFTVQDTLNSTKTFTLSNKRSKVLIDDKECIIPMTINDGWQYISINLSDTLKHSFSLDYQCCKEISVLGMCSIAGVYYGEDEYADVQLPPYLQVFQHQD